MPRQRRNRQSFAQRLAATRDLVGYTPEDAERVAATRSLILPSANAIADAVYGYLLSHPETAVYFSQPDGRPDSAHLLERAHSLKAWLLTAIEAPLDEENAAYLAGIGRAHTSRGGRVAERVKGRYLLSTVSFVQSALVDLLDGQIEDRAELLATLVAWNKLLMIHLDVFLAVYGGAEGTPHWY